MPKLISQPLTQTRPANAEQARSRLTEGNTRFPQLIEKSSSPPAVHQEVIHLCLASFGIVGQPDRIPVQQPFAAVLSCSDARVSARSDEIDINQDLRETWTVVVDGF